MTREERELSIKYLEDIKENFIEGEGYEIAPLPEYYAIENAIKSLKQEFVLDKVRAEMLKEVVSHSGTGEEVIQAYADGLKKGLDIIDKCRKKKWRDKYGRFRIMELVIKISEETFKATCNRCMLPQDVENVANAFRDSTTLPEGHGKLIDASNLPTVTEYDGKNEKTYVLYDEIDNATTIIEADKRDYENDYYKGAQEEY
jgi:phosphoribosylpyrophosphate synthetase